MKLLVYALKRLALLPFQLLLISVVTFVLVRMLPGDPARLELGPLASDEAVQALRNTLKLDHSLVTQYLAYLSRMLEGDFGRSWVNSSQVLDDVIQRMPATLELMIAGLLLVALVLGPLAFVSALRSNNLWVRGAKKVSLGYGMLAGALPDFWLGLLLIFVFFTQLGWLPGPEGRLGILDLPPEFVTGFLTIDSLLAGDVTLFVSAVTHLLLPAITLAFVYGAPIFKMARTSLETALRSQYSVYGEALGLPNWRVILYAVRNAAPPTIVMIGVITGYLLGGAVLIETVFNLNGLGQYAVQSITTADYAPVQIFVLVAAVFTKLTYLIIDLIYFALDPRVTAGGTK